MRRSLRISQEHKSPTYLNHGTYGCVFEPSIPCTDGSVVVDREAGVVSKVFKDNSKGLEAANKEVSEYNHIRDVDAAGNFTVKLHKQC